MLGLNAGFESVAQLLYFDWHKDLLMFGELQRSK
jgi:hypothetical protein